MRGPVARAAKRKVKKIILEILQTILKKQKEPVARAALPGGMTISPASSGAFLNYAQEARINWSIRSLGLSSELFNLESISVSCVSMRLRRSEF